MTTKKQQPPLTYGIINEDSLSLIHPRMVDEAGFDTLHDVMRAAADMILNEEVEDSLSIVSGRLAATEDHSLEVDTLIMIDVSHFKAIAADSDEEDEDDE